MPATDQFNVTAAVTPANPKTGDTITVTITGDDVQTTTTAGTGGPLTLHLASSDGATLDFTVPSFPIQIVTATHESVKITGVTDPAGRTWTVAAGGLTASAVV